MASQPLLPWQRRPYNRLHPPLGLGGSSAGQLEQSKAASSFPGLLGGDVCGEWRGWKDTHRNSPCWAERGTAGLAPLTPSSPTDWGPLGGPSR